MIHAMWPNAQGAAAEASIEFEIPNRSILAPAHVKLPTKAYKTRSKREN